MTKVTKEQLLNTHGEFTWMFGNQFFIETTIGNFVWSDPSYNGSNTIRPFHGSYKEYSNGNLGRDKGFHDIERYCGNEFTIVDTPATVMN